MKTFKKGKYKKTYTHSFPHGVTVLQEHTAGILVIAGIRQHSIPGLMGK